MSVFPLDNEGCSLRSELGELHDNCRKSVYFAAIYRKIQGIIISRKIAKVWIDKEEGLVDRLQKTRLPPRVAFLELNMPGPPRPRRLAGGETEPDPHPSLFI